MNKTYLRKKITYILFFLSISLNLFRLIVKLENSLPIDIDCVLILAILVMFIQYTRTEHQLLFSAFIAVTYASIIMILNYYFKLSNQANLILYIPLLICTLFYFYKAWR